jgi:hypothetical protein
MHRLFAGAVTALAIGVAAAAAQATAPPKQRIAFYVGKVYPETGPDEEKRHCFGGARGMHVWADDAVAFLDRSMRP